MTDEVVSEELILERAFKIKESRGHYSDEERQTLDNANSILNYRNGVVMSLEDYISSLLDTMLNKVDESWQPSDFLPNFSLGNPEEEFLDGNWGQKVREIQEQSKGISDGIKIVLIGNEGTEEAIPTYQTLLNRIGSVKDLTGTQDHPLARWSRGWTSEEKRHGDLLRGYSYLSGRFNMKEIEKTIQRLISSGFDPGIGEDPFKLFEYTSFQERATHISHTNTGKIAKQQGDKLLYDICTIIAKDEKRHEIFYKRCMKEIFNIDPNGAMTSYAWMMKKEISMPAKLISDGKNPNLFKDFSAAAENTGVYTTRDYAEIINHLNEYWGIADTKVTTVEATKARKYLLELPGKYLMLAERRERNPSKFDKSRFTWLKN